MIIQHQDGSLAEELGSQRLFMSENGYYAMVPTQLLDGENSVIDEIISFAFDTLGASHLDVRVYDEVASRALVGEVL